MRIIFMGAPAFSIPTLQEIAKAGHTIVAVYTRAPKPGGRRGLEIKRTPIHELAESMGLPVFTPAALGNHESQQIFLRHTVDAAVVAAYGLLLPKPILDAPKFGALNLHASLLPRWRGAAPIQRAIMAGDRETGVGLMRMEEALDTGPVALREVVPVQPDETAGELTSRLAVVAAELAVEGLRLAQHGMLSFRPQGSVGTSYAPKIGKGETEIDWRLDAERVRNHIHGLSPIPGAFSNLALPGKSERIKIYRAKLFAASGAPGAILDRNMTVACGHGAITIVEAQRAGGIMMSGAELMKREGLAVGAGFRLSAPA
jgi:methionyl-tRNA formyltransferase